MPQALKGKSTDAAAAWLLRAHRGSVRVSDVARRSTATVSF
jgi:hypothetical protein